MNENEELKALGTVEEKIKWIKKFRPDLILKLEKEIIAKEVMKKRIRKKSE